jgi:transcriptional regulator with XRE-family HTH domain
MNQNDEFASRLKGIRLHLKLKQKDFSASLGISGPSYSEIEGGKYKPGYEFLEKIVKRHNVNLYYLLFGQGEMFGGLCERCPAGIGADFLVKDKEMSKFFEYFSRSAIVQYKVMGYFHQLLQEASHQINNEMKHKGGV